MAARMVVGVAVALLAVLLAATTTGADGRDFHVGGRAGWAPNPAEPFNLGRAQPLPGQRHPR